MKIAILGFGKMGREVESVAREQGETITGTFDIDNPVRSEDLADAEMCIEFSTPESVLSNMKAAINAGKDIVVGTTGWDKDLPDVRRMVRDSGLLYSSNFSLGMNIFFRIAKRSAELMQNAPQYDPYIQEIHHRQKADSPSGTALSLAKILLDRIDRKKEILSESPDGKIGPEMLHISSTRAGQFAGTHTIGFDSDADLIELRHVAKSRRGFALGALTAARWLRGRKGVYTMDDVEL